MSKGIGDGVDVGGRGVKEAVTEANVECGVVSGARSGLCEGVHKNRQRNASKSPIVTINLKKSYCLVRLVLVIICF